MTESKILIVAIFVPNASHKSPVREYSTLFAFSVALIGEEGSALFGMFSREATLSPSRSSWCSNRILATCW